MNIFIDRFSKENYHREGLNISKIQREIGKFSVHRYKTQPPYSYYSTLVDGGDVLGDVYDLVTEQEDNYVEIEKLSGKEIWGKFQLTFVKDTTFGVADPSAPDTVRLTNGVFHTKLVD
jgi:hypothetical protein